jgi:outer membrane protein TolC
MKYIRFLLVISIILFFTASSAMADMDLPWIYCVKEAKKNHPDLVSAWEKIGQAKAAKEITRSAVLPQFTGNASEVTNKSPAGSAQVIQTGPNTEDVTKGRNRTPTDYTYGAAVQQLLFDGFKTSFSLSQNERSIYASRYAYDVTSSNIRLRLRTAYANLLAAQELLKVTEEIETRRKQTLDLVKLRYEGGREHKGSLMTSDADLAQAAYDVNQAACERAWPLRLCATCSNRRP